MENPFIGVPVPFTTDSPIVNYLRDLSVNNEIAANNMIAAGYTDPSRLLLVPPSSDDLKRYGFNDFERNLILKCINMVPIPALPKTPSIVPPLETTTTVTTVIPTTLESTENQEILWYWQNDDKNWQSYAKATSNEIEEGYKNHVDRVKLNTGIFVGKNYFVDFELMMQVNMDSQFTRKVKRVVGLLQITKEKENENEKEFVSSSPKSDLPEGYVTKETNFRLFGDTNSEARQPLAPYVLLSSADKPLDFASSLLFAYDGLLSLSDIESFLSYGEDIYEELQEKGTSLTLSECLAVYFYTLEWPQKTHNTYSLLNKALVDSNREGATKWKYYLNYLFNALQKIPKWNVQQDLYRGVNLDMVKNYPQKYQVGKKITWYSFTSTTTRLSKIMAFLPSPTKSRTIFTINGAFSGRSIQQFSALQDEAEILLPPGSRFEVIDIITVDGVTTIQLRQIPTLEKGLKLE